jgi:hypothetical protein
MDQAVEFDFARPRRLEFRHWLLLGNGSCSARHAHTRSLCALPTASAETTPFGELLPSRHHVVPSILGSLTASQQLSALFSFAPLHESQPDDLSAGSSASPPSRASTSSSPLSFLPPSPPSYPSASSLASFPLSLLVSPLSLSLTLSEVVSSPEQNKRHECVRVWTGMSLVAPARLEWYWPGPGGFRCATAWDQSKSGRSQTFSVASPQARPPVPENLSKRSGSRTLSVKSDCGS